ncbi:HK97 family phage prohead protease [Rhizorhabdus wittichii]|uniref:HK97 family phage prohead protease n=1 Tax=Rhizorhabdus wittichii TaxID=160791 RepID=A0A975HE58_9SPHN|nr:HK97 family phage prohead protease [Rhizorhabdus wittichii]
MFHKQFALEVKDITDTGVIEGYASVFGGSPDAYGDVVLPGAFTNTLNKHKRDGTMPLMLWGHQSGELPIGDWVDMKEDRKGLWAKGQLDLDDPVAARVHRAMKRKSVRGLSIGYDTILRERDPKKPGVNFLKELDLWEVSPVNFPANRAAQITHIKSIAGADHLPTLPEFEDFLREAGFSKSQATAIASKGLAPLLRGEPGSTPDAVKALRAAVDGFLKPAA